MWLEDDLTQTPIKTKHDFVDIYLYLYLYMYIDLYILKTYIKSDFKM